MDNTFILEGLDLFELLYHKSHKQLSIHDTYFDMHKFPANKSRLMRDDIFMLIRKI